jgi:hypothetical protein
LKKQLLSGRKDRRGSCFEKEVLRKQMLSRRKERAAALREKK